MSRAASLARVLATRQLFSGGWSYFHSAQTSVEATALAMLAAGPEMPRIAERAIDHLRNLQRPDGGWPAFSDDAESSWTTPIVFCALNVWNDASSARHKALEWLLQQRGREGHWFGDTKRLIEMCALTRNGMDGPGRRERQAGSFLRPSRSSR